MDFWCSPWPPYLNLSSGVLLLCRYLYIASPSLKWMSKIRSPTIMKKSPQSNLTDIHTGKFVFDMPKFYATVFASKISWRKWPTCSSTPKIFGVTYMFSSMDWYEVDIRGIFRWEALDPGSSVLLYSPTPGGNSQLCSTHFTIPLVGPRSYPWGKPMTCALRACKCFTCRCIPVARPYCTFAKFVCVVF